VRSIGGDKYEVIVGESRQVYRRKTGPRGGYIKNADWQGWATPTGSTVTAIIDAGRFIRGVLRGALARLG
jgi:hypothetical protein